MDVREKLIEILDNSFEKQYEKRGLLTAPHTVEDLITNGVTVQEWIPVNDERKPKEGEDVIVAVFDGYDTYTDIDCLMRDGKWCFETENYKVTHWMEKPQPPKGE